MKMEEKEPLISSFPEEEEGILKDKLEMEEKQDDCLQSPKVDEGKEKLRNLVAFFIFGTCCNITYIVVLAAAFDLISITEANKLVNNDQKVNVNGFRCHAKSTAIILFLSVFPILICKYTAPFIVHCCNYHVRMMIIILSGLMSLAAPGLSSDTNVILFGVVCVSMNSGFGEITYLSLSSYYKKSVLPNFTSGTGLCGMATFLYAVITGAGVSPQSTILIFLVSPIIQGVAFWFILELPPELKIFSQCGDQPLQTCPGNPKENSMSNMTFKERITRIRPLVKYMVPLFFVFSLEYTINQGLFESLYFDLPWLSQDEQYRWYYFCYQVGALIARSSTYFFRLPNIWIQTVTQAIIFSVLLIQVLFPYIPSIYIVFSIIVIEGFCGGSVYANVFLNVTEEVEEEYLEYSMGVTSAADTTGIVTASVISMPLHKALCAKYQ